MTLIPGYMVAGTWEDDDNGWPKPDLVTGHSAMSQLLGIRLNASVVTNNGLVSFTIHHSQHGQCNIMDPVSQCITGIKSTIDIDFTLIRER